MRYSLRLLEILALLLALGIGAPAARAQDGPPPPPPDRVPEGDDGRVHLFPDVPRTHCSDPELAPPEGPPGRSPSGPQPYVVASAPPPAHDRRIVLEATGFFVFALKPNANVDETGSGENSVLSSAHVRSGEGWGVRVGGGFETDGDIFLRATIGVLYLQTEHFETHRRTFARTSSGYIEPMAEGVWGGKTVGFSAGVGVGVGFSYFHFKHGFDDEGSGGLEARMALAVTFFQQVDVGITLGYFLWGYPGRTLGDGGFGALTLTARF